MQLTYQGRHTEGVFVVSGDAEIFIGHGETVEVDDELGAKLMNEQPEAFVSDVKPAKSTKSKEAE